MAEKNIERVESAPAAETAPVSAAEPTASTPNPGVRRSFPALAVIGIVLGGLIVAGALFGGGVLVGTQLPGGMPGVSGPMHAEGMRGPGGPGGHGERPTPPDQRGGDRDHDGDAPAPGTGTDTDSDSDSDQG